ncbi:hypothetical protein [Novilysobacter luteus]|uniref:Lipoprotein n=1 Tax=Novilysobacter luteus TaxID=2822368 RepID=A0ABM8UEX2_9GAMM|nr:hypothetical protein [Lysobacter luteus]CAG4972098.1 hypothetical protein LYB30171_01125 [Lysobacter luteus]
MVSMLRSGLWAVTGLLVSACVLSAPGGQATGAKAERVLVAEELNITENGAASPDVDAGACRAFLLDEDAARRALENSEPVSRSQYMHELPWSPCLVRGRITLVDGRTGTWTIRQYGTGSILLDDDAELYFWCRRCTNPPFVAVE